MKDYLKKITQLVAINPYQLCFEEYAYIAQIVKQKNGNFLVFSVGNDSQLWLDINHQGKTVFLEDHPDWLRKVKAKYKSLEAYLVRYQTQLSQWQTLLKAYETEPTVLELDLPEKVMTTNWDYIFVDAPAGYEDQLPGRMKSIYMASQLARQFKPVDIFVHDCDRKVEQVYCDYFLKPENLVIEFARLRHYQI